MTSDGTIIYKTKARGLSVALKVVGASIEQEDPLRSEIPLYCGKVTLKVSQMKKWRKGLLVLNARTLVCYTSKDMKHKKHAILLEHITRIMVSLPRKNTKLVFIHAGSHRYMFKIDVLEVPVWLKFLKKACRTIKKDINILEDLDFYGESRNTTVRSKSFVEGKRLNSLVDDIETRERSHTAPNKTKRSLSTCEQSADSKVLREVRRRTFTEGKKNSRAASNLSNGSMFSKTPPLEMARPNLAKPCVISDPIIITPPERRSSHRSRHSRRGGGRRRSKTTGERRNRYKKLPRQETSHYLFDPPHKLRRDTTNVSLAVSEGVEEERENPEAPIIILRRSKSGSQRNLRRHLKQSMASMSRNAGSMDEYARKSRSLNHSRSIYLSPKLIKEDDHSLTG